MDLVAVPDHRHGIRPELVEGPLAPGSRGGFSERPTTSKRLLRFKST